MVRLYVILKLLSTVDGVHAEQHVVSDISLWHELISLLTLAVDRAIDLFMGHLSFIELHFQNNVRKCAPPLH